MQAKEIYALNDAGNPLKRLAASSNSKGVESLMGYCDPDSLADSLLEAHGEVAYHLVEQEGYVLAYGDKGFYFRKANNGYGFKAGSSVEDQLDLLGLFIYTFLLANSSKVAPGDMEGKVFLNSYNIAHKPTRRALSNSDNAVEFLKYATYECSAALIFHYEDPTEDATPVEYLNKFLPWLAKTSEGLVLSGTAKGLSVAVPSHIYNQLDEEAQATAVAIDYLPKAPAARADKAVVEVIIQLFANIVNTNQNTYIKLSNEANGDLSVIFDGTSQYFVKEDGVYREDLRVQNMLVQEEDHAYTDLGYFDSFSSFLYILMCNLKLLRTLKTQTSGATSPIGTWEKRYMQKTLPLDREFEQGTAINGIRPYYNAMVSQAVKCKSFLPISIWQVEDEETGLVSYEYKWSGVQFSTKVKKDELAALAMERYSLFLSSKSMSWMDMGLLGFRIADLPKSIRRNTLLTLLMDASGCIDICGAINKLFKTNVPVAALETALQVLEQDLFVTASEKIPKIDARIKLGTPTSPNWLVGGVQASWVHVDQLAQGYGVDIVFRNPCILGNTIVDEPGIIKKLRELGTFFVQFAISDKVENFSQDHIEFQYEFTEVETHPSGKETYLFGDNAEYVYNNGYETVKLSDYAAYNKAGEFVGQTKLNGVFVQKDQSVLNIGYTNSYIQANVEGGYLYKCIKVDTDCIVQSVELFKNAHGSLEYKILGLYPEDKFKGRGPMKAMSSFSITGSHYLYNSLNGDLPEGVAVVLTSDSLKHKDLLMKELPYVTATLVANGLGNMIAEVNERLGFPAEDKFLYYSNAACALSEYESLRVFFWERYGQTRWVYRRDVADGMHSINREAYLNESVKPDQFDTKNKDHYWVEQKLEKLVADGIVPAGKFSDKASVIVACTHGNPYRITDVDDIMIFDTDDTENVPLVFWQRGYVAGPIVNEASITEHTYCEMKPELSDFRANSTHTKLMQGIARVLEFDNGMTPACYDLAAVLLSDYKERVDRYAAIVAMTQGLDFTIGGEPVPVIDVFGKSGNVSLQFLSFIDEELEGAIERQDVNLKHLHRCYNRVVLNLDGYKVFLPAIAEQDMQGNSSDGASGLLLDLMKDILVRTTLENCVQRIARLRRAVETIVGAVSGEGGVEGLSIMRQMTQGRKSVLAKVIGMAGIPVNVAAVSYSRLRGSVYQNVLEDVLKLGYTEEDLLAGNLWTTQEGDIHCVRARSPLLFVHMLRIVVIKPGQFIITLPEGKLDLFNLCDNPWVMFVNPAVAGVDKGDFDGLR